MIRLLLIGILLSIAAVAPWRWIDPPYSAVMLQRLVGAESRRGPLGLLGRDVEQLHDRPQRPAPRHVYPLW